MDRESLFTPSLKQEDHKLETYDIRKLLYVAFFGGVIPLIGLATQNAKRFKVDRSIIISLAALGGLILLGKYFIAYTILDNHAIMDQRTLRWVYKAASCLLYLAYYKVMNSRFQVHISYGGELKPMLKAAIVWILIGIAVEAGIGIAAAWFAMEF